MSPPAELEDLYGIKLHPKAQTKGFALAIRNYLFKLMDDPEYEEYQGLSDRERRARVIELLKWEGTIPPDIRPDLYEIREEEQLIRLFEIEDTNPLPDRKLTILFNWGWHLVLLC